MEGCPRLPAIGFDLKLSIESIDLCEKIPNYITTNYQEDGANYTNECQQINQLRETAMNCSIDESSLRYLKRYYCQLLLLRNRFPMFSDAQCSVRFTWEDGFQRDENTYNDIRFEEASVLYNIGGVYSRLGVNEARRTHESLKVACTYFRYGAACYEKIRDQYLPYSVDFTPELLTCQADILMAQAHEAVLEKSILDQRPHSVNAHVAMKISEYSQTALHHLTKPGIGSIATKRFREWRAVLTYKISFYLALTYYYHGLIAEENKKYGETVCYFENALERLRDGWKNAEKHSTEKTNLFREAHIFLYNIIEEKYKIVKRHNDNVYFEKVPSLSSLPAIQGIIVAKSQEFDFQDPEISGPDIFQKLIPLNVRSIIKEYNTKKAKLLQEVTQLIESRNQELETFLGCLQLNRLLLNQESLRLPRELLDCCASIALRPTMTNDLILANQHLKSQHESVCEKLNEFEQALQAFEENNNAFKSNKEFDDLKTNLKNTREMTMLSSNENSRDFSQKMTTAIEHFKILNLPIDELEKTLPAITELTDEMNKSKLANLALLYEKVQTMKKQRGALFDDFRKKIENDDITKFVLTQHKDDHEKLSTEQLKKHDEMINIIKQNCMTQDTILHSITEANANVAEIRTKVTAKLENRDRLIRDFIVSFKSFDDILLKANELMEYYKKQSTAINSLNERLTILKSQHLSQTHLNREISSQQDSLPFGSDVPNVYDRPRLKDYLPLMKPETWGSTSNQASARLGKNKYMTSMNNYYRDRWDYQYSSNSNVPNLEEQMFPSIPACSNQTQFQIPSSVQHDQISMPGLQPTAPSSLTLSNPTIHQQTNSFDHDGTFLNQNFTAQKQMNNNPVNNQYFSQQHIYSSQPFPFQQPTYQSSVQFQSNQPLSHHCYSSDAHSSQAPSMWQYQNLSGTNPSTQRCLSSLPAIFDPYRPQPIGAYDIPKPQVSPLTCPQHVYQPGSVLQMNQIQTPSSSLLPSINGISSENNFPTQNPTSSTFISALANLSIHSMPNYNT